MSVPGTSRQSDVASQETGWDPQEAFLVRVTALLTTLIAAIAGDTVDAAKVAVPRA